MSSLNCKILMLGFILFVSNINVFAEQSSYIKLEKQIKLKQYIKAYQSAEKLRENNEGEPRFDFLYGLAALQTGHYNEAVFALSRVTATNPQVIRPRLELARAYLKINNTAAALKEFYDVLALSPPPIVRNKVSAFIVEINKNNGQPLHSVLKQLAAFSVGYSSNINFGNDDSEIDLPRFGLVTLNSSVVKQQSGFAEAKFQLMQKKKISKNRSLVLIGNLTHKKYFKTSEFDFTELDLRAGLGIDRDNNKLQFLIRDRSIFLNDGLYSNTLGIDAVLQKKMGNGKLSYSLSLEKYDDKKQSYNDRKRATLGLKLGKVIGKKAQHQFSLLLGKEFPDKKKGKPMSRDFAGVAYKLSNKWSLKNTSFLNIDYQKYEHQAAYSIFPDSKRKDDRFIINLAHEIKLSKKATIALSVKHIDNRSNLALYDAKRNEVKVGVRYEY